MTALLVQATQVWTLALASSRWCREATAGPATSTVRILPSVDTNESADNLSVGFDNLPDGGAADADVSSKPVPVTAASEVSTSEVPLDEPSTTPAESSAAPATSSSPADSTLAPASSEGDVTTSGVDSGVPVDTTGEIPGRIWARASWVDLPATFEIVDLPDVNLTFVWSVAAVPEGSEIGAASLSNTNTSSVSFVPDVAGIYTLTASIASDGSSTLMTASVQVSNVDVAFLQVTTAYDGGYVHEPKMVPSDGVLDPMGVGCGFDTWIWEPHDYTNWREALVDESQMIGFRYPAEVGQETWFAYHYRTSADGAGVLHVANATSDCALNRPTDLGVGYYPDFSPSGAELSRVDTGDGVYLLSSPVEENTTLDFGAADPVATDWWDEDSIVWASSNTYYGQYAPVMVGLSSKSQEGYTTVLDCSYEFNDIPLFDQVDEVAAVAGGLLIRGGWGLWYLPVLTGDGLPSASCDYFSEGNIQVASSVADFEVSPDGQTVAVISRIYENDQAIAVIGVGPVGEPFDTQDASWRMFEAGSGEDYYTGLHWIAGSEQLVWTAVQYSETYSDYAYRTELFDSAIYKINADGTHRRTLVYNSGLGPYNYAQSVVTTGPIDLLPYQFVGGTE